MEDEAQDGCYGAGSIAGAVIGTFLTTALLLAVAALLYRQWKRHKGKHLVLVTDPEIVEDAYAFDNPCFKDATPAIGRSIERPVSAASVETPVKDAARWVTPWSSLGLGSTNRNDKRRTLDDSCLGPKATRVSVVSLRSRDFTGLGFNVCGNMREGIFVKDLLHRGPASVSGRIHPGDRIASVKISFRNMVYEDALTILSYASPYDVELEVESGGPGSKPTTLLKKSIGPSPTRICHPLYRSQSIPELSQTHKSSAKRLFTADLNESLGSNYSTMNSTLKSSKSTPGNQTLERRHEESKTNHHKFGIKVLPALDGTVHRIENQNEHNTNLERRNSKKMDVEEHLANTRNTLIAEDPSSDNKRISESIQWEENKYDISPLQKNLIRSEVSELNGIDVPDTGDEGRIPFEIPAEVHNAAVAARRNRKSSSELLTPPKVVVEPNDADDAKSPQKNKRKAPAPPKGGTPSESPSRKDGGGSFQSEPDDKFDSITDYTESLSDYVNKVRETTDGAEARRQRLENQASSCRRNSESDTDSELQNSFTTIELNPADITIHHTPVPEVDDDMYRKAASLGDLSKYESKTPTTLERAQSLDMTDTGSKKRKAPLPPEDINESTEDLTKLDQMDTFERRKLKKSNEWGTLEDAIWSKGEPEEETSRTRKKSNGTLERSKSAIEMKLKEDTSTAAERLNVSDSAAETSVELYNLHLSKKLSHDFIRTERMFNPDEDNSLAMIVNDGTVVKSPTLEEIELDFRQAKPLPDEDEGGKPEVEEFGKALHYFELHTRKPPVTGKQRVHLDLSEGGEIKKTITHDEETYEGRKEVVEETITKVTVAHECPGCKHVTSQHNTSCNNNIEPKNNKTTELTQVQGKDLRMVNTSEHKPLEYMKAERSQKPEAIATHSSKVETFESKKPNAPTAAVHVQSAKFESPETENKRDSVSSFQTHRTKFEPKLEIQSNISKPLETTFETHFAKRVVNVSDDKDDNIPDSGSNITVNSKNVSISSEDQHNISNISVSSGENSEDSGVVGGTRALLSRQDSEPRPPLPSTPMPLPTTPHKMTYITEIKVSTSRENIHEPESDNEEIVAIMEGNSELKKQHGVTVTSNGKPMPGKKPPIPPRRSDVTKVAKENPDQQVVYVSEYKSIPGKDSQVNEVSITENKHPGAIGKKFEQWVFLGENKDNPWGNGSSQPQPVTNIVLSSTEDK